MFYSDEREKAVNKAKEIETKYNTLVNRGNEISIFLYEERKASVRAIFQVEQYINSLANSPKEFKRDISEVIKNLSHFREAMILEKEAEANNLIAAGTAAGGTAVAGAVAFLGPTAAMAIATTFGTASTGVAISALSGAAANSAALAWLGGGALAAGGGGMAAGNALLALAGPVGWGLAAASIIGGGAFACYKNKEVAEKANEYAIKTEESIRKLSCIIERIVNLRDKTIKLRNFISLAPFRTYPNDYKNFTNKHKQALAVLVNNCMTLGVLINERIDQ